MDKQKSFKERVKDTIILCAKPYKDYYVNYEYLICSSAFVKHPYYIISAHEDNYLHLTGVHTKLDPTTFFNKSYKGKLEESDFDFRKKGQNESEVKGSIRRKINTLPSIMSMFDCQTIVEEDFTKNRIKCALAAGNIEATLGFISAGKAKPMTLLKGNELDKTKAKSITLVLRKRTGDIKFSDMVAGDLDTLKQHKTDLLPLLSEELLSKINNVNN